MQEKLLKKIALNSAQKPNRGLAFVNDLAAYDRLTHEPWLAKMVDDIRSGHDALKDARTTIASMTTVVGRLTWTQRPSSFRPVSTSTTWRP